MDAALVALAPLLVLALGTVIERLAGRSLCPSNMDLNLRVWVLTMVLPPAVMVGLATMAGISALVDGLIDLPAGGWGLLWAIPLFVLVMEFSEYLFHRAQHAWPLLWAMHSLHHSDGAFGITTTVRHFWAEHVIRILLLRPLVLIVLQPSPAVLAVYAAVAWWSYVDHLDLRLSFGRWQPILSSPLYHRIHHAADPRYMNRNFAAVFPLFDLLFGTYHRPQPGEYPSTGLVGGEQPKGGIDAAFWPLVRHRRAVLDADRPQASGALPSAPGCVD
jgi:sterol desaturase/sphingolipid hydroxylase (fatty acid hydroxylase superfamily)